MNVPEPTIRPESYRVTWLPDDDPNVWTWSVTVEWRNKDSWAVCHGPYCLSESGEWEYELRPSDRTPAWERTHRFNLDTALALAKKAGPELNVNGLTIADLIAKKAGNP